VTHSSSRLALLAICAAVTMGATPPPETSRALADLFEDHFEATLELEPLLATSIGDARYNDRLPMTVSAEHRGKVEALSRRSLDRLKAIDGARLSEPDRLSYDVFRSALERTLEGLRFPAEWLLPVDQNRSLAISFVQLGSGRGLHPFKTAKDYDDFLKRAGAFSVWVDQAIAAMREGLRTGYVQPKVVIEKALPVLAAQLVEKPEESLFWGPITQLPAGLADADKDRLTAAYRKVIASTLVPAYRRLHDFTRDEYLPRCRETVGIDALPEGAAYYAYRVRTSTTTPQTAAQIHDLGLAEVKRLHQEIRGLMQRVKFTGDLPTFFAHMQTDPKFRWSTPEEVIADYHAVKKKVDAALPRLFETLPKADYEVRPVEKFRERTASGGSYQAATPDGSRPGIFYANTYDLKSRSKWGMESLSLHEGNPGHHLQISVAREADSLPRFRRFGHYTAYIEGWGLYAESLGHELGAYEDPYQDFGRLAAELWRAIRLVVDTGIHSKGWTRQQVIDYMSQNSASGEASRQSETDRYISWPAQALAYKIGELKIRELRARAEQKLGAKFDVRRFHTEILKDGALPLDVLEAKIDRWIAAQAS
jgi:uncharacterized protein (DUF885 family)